MVDQIGQVKVKHSKSTGLYPNVKEMLDKRRRHPLKF